MATTLYSYLRGLELEGRHPNDAGFWGVTLHRLFFGEGLPPPSDPGFEVSIEPESDLPPAPRLSRSSLVRSAFYRRIRTADEAVLYLKTVMPSLGCGMEIFRGFVAEHNGIVPMPEPGETPLPLTHAVEIKQFGQQSRKFLFANSWGEDWGKQGLGLLPYDYFDNYVFECWGPYVKLSLLSIKTERAGEYNLARWIMRDEWQRRVYGFELLRPAGGERLGWSFAIERDGALEVEELYVRPEFRGRGLGSLLADRLNELFLAKRGHVRLWVPFSDARDESPGTFPKLEPLARRLGLVYRRCPVRWAAYLASNETAGETSRVPIEPIWFPDRPRSPYKAVLAAALMMGHVAPPEQSGPLTHPDVGAAASEGTIAEPIFPEIDSEDWRVMNRRRAELIDRKVRQGLDSLSKEEFKEYERLQRMSLRALKKKYPRPRFDRAEFEALRRELRKEKEGHEA